MTEAHVESFAAETFQVCGIETKTLVELADAGFSFKRDFVASVVRRSIGRGNLHLPDLAIDTVVASLSRPPHPTLIENNRHVHSLLTDGVPVEYKDAKSGETRGGRARVRDV